MPRPKTKGPAIAFRLPLAAHEVIEERASRAGVSPSEWVAAQMVKWARTQASAPAAGRGRDVEPRLKGKGS